MIEYFARTKEGVLEEVPHFQKDVWVNVSSPSQDDIDYLIEELNIPEDFMRYAVDRDETARIEKDMDEDVTLVIYDIPYYNGDSEDSIYSTLPMSFIIKKHCIITVSTDFQLLEHYQEATLKKTLDPAMPTRFVLQFLYESSKKYLAYLRTLNKRRKEIEKNIGTKPRNEDLMQLMRIERSLIYFIMSLKTNNLVLEKIRRGFYLITYEEDNELLEDLIIETQQGIEMAEISNRIINESTDTYANLISNNTNEVMKFLTVYSLILSIPTIVFSFYGMNVHLPFADWKTLSWILVTIIAIIISIGFIFYFKRKDYF